LRQGATAGRAEILPGRVTEGRKGNEETGIGSGQISKQALFLRLMVKVPQLFAGFCSK
jgi:hypothetical protein